MSLVTLFAHAVFPTLLSSLVLQGHWNSTVWPKSLRRENVAITPANMLVSTAAWRQSASYKIHCFPLTFHELIMGGC